MTQVKIQGENYDIAEKYSAGHALTAGEASALNQTFFENIRNNVAVKLKKAAEAGPINVQHWQAEIDAYASAYEFGVRAVRSSSLDPIEVEAGKLAAEAIKGMLKAGIKSGKIPGSLRDYLPQMDELVANALASENGDNFRLKATRNIEEMREAADSIRQLEFAPSASSAEAPPSKAKKKKAA